MSGCAEGNELDTVFKAARAALVPVGFGAMRSPVPAVYGTWSMHVPALALAARMHGREPELVHAGAMPADCSNASAGATDVRRRRAGRAHVKNMDASSQPRLHGSRLQCGACCAERRAEEQYARARLRELPWEAAPRAATLIIEAAWSARRPMAGSSRKCGAATCMP